MSIYQSNPFLAKAKNDEGHSPQDEDARRIRRVCVESSDSGEAASRERQGQGNRFGSLSSGGDAHARSGQGLGPAHFSCEKQHLVV